MDETNLIAEAASDRISQLRHQRHGLRRVNVAKLDVTNGIRKSEI